FSFFHPTPSPDIYTLSLHDALPIYPDESPLFKRYPTVSGDHHLVEFTTDYLRMMVSGNLNAFEIENLMDNEIETHHHEAMVPSQDRKSTRLNSSHVKISYAVFCLKK